MVTARWFELVSPIRRYLLRLQQLHSQSSVITSTGGCNVLPSSDFCYPPETYRKLIILGYNFHFRHYFRFWRSHNRSLSTQTVSSLSSPQQKQPNEMWMMTTTVTSIPKEEETKIDSNDTSNTIIDNPCWGSPTSCDLQDLLGLLLDKLLHQPGPRSVKQQDDADEGTTYTTPTNTRTLMNILYESSDYIVLNKPPDLRMDGNFPATVTKLLLYYYPPASLLPSSSSSSPTLLLSSSSCNQNHKKRKSIPMITTSKSDVNVPVQPSDETFIDDHCNHPNINNQDDTVDTSTNKYTATPTAADIITTSTSRFSTDQLQLLHRISTIARFCDVKDNELRPCHQLDYATSGVLLIARSKPTAARARTAFEDRNVHKMYTAVVLGHVPLPNHHQREERYFSQKSIEQYGGDPTNVIHHWSYVTQRALQGTMEQLEYNYRKSRHRHQKVTFFGYLPDSNIFNRWQDRERVKHKNRHLKPKTHVVSPPKQQDDTKKRTKHVWNKKRGIEWDSIFEEVDRLCYDVKLALLNLKWDNLKKSESELDCAIVKKFERAGQEYNAIAKENITAQARNDRIINEALPTLPTFFRVKHEETKLYSSDGTTTTTTTTTTDKDSLSFYIFAPLAQDDVTNNFSMLLHPNQHSLCPYLPVGDPTIHDFKPSLTKCTILHRTFYTEHKSKSSVNDTTMVNPSETTEHTHPVTIVQLEPRTGRRHQLRIHMAMLGHPIAGDATYCNNNNSKERTMVDRLCLHSTQLHIPNLLGPEKDLNIICESPFRYHETKLEDMVDKDDEVTSYVTIDDI